RQARDIQAIERHAGVKLSPWVKDAHVAPTPITAPPRRHSKPRVSTNGDGREGTYSKVIVSGGRAAGLEPSDIIHAITSATELDGESVRNVRVLERFAFAEVPQKDAERVVEQTGGTEVRGHVLRLELARTCNRAPATSRPHPPRHKPGVSAQDFGRDFPRAARVVRVTHPTDPPYGR